MTEVSAALIRQGRKFMICQRPKNKSRALLWEFAGGKAENGETGEQALVRECQEELGITVEVGNVFAEKTHIYPDITIRLTVYNAVIKKGTPILKEHNDLKWITPEEIDNYDFCPADTDILIKIKKEF